MSLISKQIANLFNGVSQQTPSARLPSQADLQENALSSPVDGLVKRPGTDHVARLMDAPVARPKVHTIDRDINEQYQVVITNGDLKVFDLQGNPKVVDFPAGKSYLSSLSPRDDIKVTTVADYSFTVNRTVRPQMAVTPYRTTDRIAVTLNFGSGELGAPASWPLPQYSRFRYAYQNGFTSGGQPLWNSSPGSPGPYGTFDEAYAAMLANLTASGYDVPDLSHTTWDIKDVALQPEYADGTGDQEPYMLGVMATPKFPILISHPSLGSSSFDCRAMIIYSKATSGGVPINTLPALRADVGWPTRPYHVPGTTYAKHVFPVFDGELVVSVNGSRFSISQQNGWSAEEYTEYFANAIQAAFPGLTVAVNDGWQIAITGAEGEAIYVAAWDTNHRGYVRAVYTELPQREAVFIVIKNGVAGQTYAVSLNGTQYSVTTGPTESPETYKVDTIANNLAGEINAGTTFQAAVYGNFIMVQRPDGVPITFASHDTWNNQAMYAMKNRVQAFEDLPGQFLPGYPIEVVGVDGSSGFFVHYTQKGVQAPKAYGLERQVRIERPFTLIMPAGTTWNAVESEETGLWEECAKPGTPDVYIPGTMPHVLISEKDGTFTFKPVEWYRRPCGDNDSVPAASFVDKEILDVFFHRNRLGFMSGETLVFSKAGEFFNLWPSTARDVLDSDPIDVQVNHTKVSTLRNTAVFNNQLLVFSDSTQFVISGAQLLSPKTISVQASTEFDASAKCKPITVGQAVQFVSEGSKWSSVWEYYVEQNAVQNTAENITQHVPKYLPKDISKLVSSTEDNLVVALSDLAPGTLFVYRYLWGNEGKLQQSWSKWTTQGEILDVAFAADQMVLTVRRSDGLFLESMDLNNDVTDGDLDWRVHLDRKVVLPATPSGAHSVVVLPYAVPENLRVLRTDRGTLLKFKVTADFPAGTPAPAPNEVWVDGSYTEVMVGVAYTFRYRFSEVHMRDNEGRAILGSQLMLKTWALNYENSAEFDLVVTPEKRAPFYHRFRPKTIGIDALLGVVKPESGMFRKMVSGEGKTTALEIVSESHLPCAFQSAVWEANYTLRTKRS